MTAKGAFNNLLKVLGEFKLLSEDIQIDTVHVFCLIAANPGITSKEILVHTNMTQSSISRHLALLSEYSWKGTDGLDLIENIEDLADRRYKKSFLKHKGRSLAAKIAGLLSGEEVSLTEFPLSKDMNTRRGGGAR